MSQARFKILEKYNYQVPRYTSYPPATQFRDIEDGKTYAQWLSSADKDISLYIHIPFCARLCHYCGCHMRVVNTYQPVEDYLDVLKAEIALIQQHLPAKTRISHLHFGGGSPTILKPADFRRLMQYLEERFSFKSGMEIGIEADPRNLSEAKIAAYAKAGVNRLSMGVQDFNEDVLNLINRPQPFHVTYRALQLCKSYGIDNINFDLMYGLPAQTEESILKTMDIAVSLKPARIAYFGYAHVPWMKRHMNLMPQERIPGPKDRYVLQDSGARFLEHAGYTPIGIDHYALPGDALCHALESGTLHRNFQGYTTDRQTSLVGLGASSIGAFASGYAQNRIDTRGYMEEVRAGRLPVHKMLAFQNSDLPVRKIIERLMCYLTVDLAQIKKEFSLPDSAFPRLQELKRLEEDGVIHLRNQTITINPDYRVLARVVCEVFDEYALKDMSLQRHAQAV